MLLLDSELKKFLIASKTLNKSELENLSVSAANSRISLQEAILEKGVISDEELGKIIANYLKVPFVVLSKAPLIEDICRIVPERLARKYKVIAFAKDKNNLKLAMTDPTNSEIPQVISQKTSLTVIPYLATERDIEKALNIYRKELKQTLDELLAQEIRKSMNAVDDAPIAKIVDLLITSAYRDKASDIHFEPEEGNLLVRFRIDSILHDVLYLDKKLHGRIVTRIKVLARLRTDEHLSAQDGKMVLMVDDENLDIRVSIIPITEGEKVVLRLLSSRFRALSLGDLGMNEKDLRKVDSAMKKAYGMILSTGPTGSGKTTSIYSILKVINTRDKNITTIEDPVEYRIKGVNQIQVNPKTDLTFANGLRSILRQDPNVIFVGEIRDSETASIAVNAALTGHLVLSTLHTSDAATTLPRLIDMKVEPFLVASTVNIIIAQRLVRKICTECKTKKIYKKTELLKDMHKTTFSRHFRNRAKLVFYYGKGCTNCHFTGYIGRIGIFEVMEISEKIKRLIVEKNGSDTLEKQAMLEGMTTMLDDGLAKVKSGITSIEEVIRVTKVES